MNCGYEGTSGVLAGEVLTLVLKEIPVQRKYFVVALNTNRPDSLPCPGSASKARSTAAVRVLGIAAPGTRQARRPM